MYKIKQSILLAGLLVAALLLATALLASVPGQARAASPDGFSAGDLSEEGDVLVSIEPEAVSISAGEEFTVTVRVQTGQQVVDVIMAYLDVNPKVLEVVAMLPATGLMEPILWLGDLYNNETGQIFYGAYAPWGQSGIQGSFDLVHIRFRAIKASLNTGIKFSREGERKTTFVAEGYALPYLATDGRVLVAAPTPTPTVAPLRKTILPLILHIS